MLELGAVGCGAYVAELQRPAESLFCTSSGDHSSGGELLASPSFLSSLFPIP